MTKACGMVGEYFVALDRVMNGAPSRVSGAAQQASIEDMNSWLKICDVNDSVRSNSLFLQCQPDGSLRQIPEVRVTDDMRSVGFKVGIQHQPGAPLLVETLDAIYRAMHAVAPVPLVSEAEDRIAKLEAEIATLQQEVANRLTVPEVDALLAATGARIAELELDAEKSSDAFEIVHRALKAAKAKLAQHGESVTFMADPPPTHTVGDMKPEPVREPKPIPAGALNPTATDRRRIGG